jgi:hypothetical protein
LLWISKVPAWPEVKRLRRRKKGRAIILAK